MNFEKLFLVHLIRNKDIKSLLSSSDNLFIKVTHKVLFKALKNYHKTHGRIPDIAILIEAIKAQMPEEKSTIYVGVLEGLELYDGEIPDGVELLRNLQDAYVISEVDKNIEKLVEAAKDKNVSSVSTIIKGLQAITVSTNKTPENILNIDYTPSKIRVIDSCLDSMRLYNSKIGGLTLIGGTTGGGKSIFTLQQLMYSFTVSKISTCLLNMELSTDETISRMFSHATGTDFADVYGNTDPSMVAKVNSWKQKYFSSPDADFRIRSVRYSVSEIEATIRQQASEGVVLFGIDYLQIADLDVSSDEWKQLSYLVRTLHQLTQELQIVIVSPVQINFSDTKIVDNELKVTIRGSRELEFSSTLFLFIYQSPEEYKENVCRMFTMKARNAKKYIYLLQTDFSKMKFEDTGVVL